MGYIETFVLFIIILAIIGVVSSTVIEKIKLRNYYIHRREEFEKNGDTWGSGGTGGCVTITGGGGGGYCEQRYIHY